MGITNKSLFLGSLFALTTLSACAEDDLPKYIELKELRVLALQAGAAGGLSEFSPGDNVTITPHISDYYGGVQALSYQAFACIDPGIQVGAEPSCAGVPGAVSVGSGAAAIPATSRTGSTTSFSVTVPVAILAGRSTQSQYNGVTYLVTYALTAANGQSVSSFKRIVVSENTKITKNRNPQTSDLLANGATVASFPTGKVALSVSYPGSSLETYDSKKSDNSLQSSTEELLTTWFITDGELEFYRTVNTATTKFDPKGPAPGSRQPLIIGVTRDDRGGVTILIRQL